MNANFHIINPQLNSAGQLIHLLSMEGLTPALLQKILDKAATFLDREENLSPQNTALTNKIAANVFFEASTRTRSTFELAEKHLGMTVLTLNIDSSSTKKGETLLDTLSNLQAMGVDLFVIRHGASGAAFFAAQHLTNTAVINAGDGAHEHPTQALLDMFTIWRRKKDFSKLKVAIVGDIKHSRVARSQIYALSLLGVPEIRVIAPKTLLPTAIKSLGVHVHHDLKQGLRDVDVVTVLRLQSERMHSGLIGSVTEYYRAYGVTEEKLSVAKSDVLVLHPGPMNRGIEIATSVAEGQHSAILSQVRYGMAVRMAIISLLMNNRAPKT